MANTGAEQTLEGWTNVAGLYAEHIDPVTSLYAEHALELLPPSQNGQVLDVAAGAGALAVQAAQTGADVTAIDFTPAMVEIIHDKASKKDLDNLEAKVMDGQDLDFEDDTFQSAYSVFGLMLFPERGQGFSELHRVLTPSEKAMVVTWDSPPNNEWFALFDEVIQTALPELSRPEPPSFMQLADTDQLAKEMTDAGFQEVEISTWTGETLWENAEQAWIALAQANPIFLPMLKKIGKEKADHLRSVFKKTLEDRFEEGPIRLSANAHYALGTA